MAAWKAEWDSYEVHQGPNPEPLGPVYSKMIDKVLANEPVNYLEMTTIIWNETMNIARDNFNAKKQEWLE